MASYICACVTYFKTKLGIWLLSKYPRGQHRSFKMSKCNSIAWLKITGIGNLDVIYICAIEACVWDFESIVSSAIFVCNNSCMESRYHNFILAGVQEYVWRWRISTNYGYFFVDSENKDKYLSKVILYASTRTLYSIHFMILCQPGSPVNKLTLYSRF